MNETEKQIFELACRIGERDGFGVEYYLDYREVDIEDDQTKAKIVTADEPYHALDDMLWEWMINIDCPEHYRHIIDEIRDDLELDDYNDSDIFDILREADFYVSMDTDWFLTHNKIMTTIIYQQADIYLPNNWTWRGDNLYSFSNWPGETQRFFNLFGTTFAEFRDWFNAPKSIRSKQFPRHKLLNSIWREFSNSFYNQAQLVALCYPTLKEFIELRQAKQIIIHPGTELGFVNFFPGSGSVLEIEIDRPIVARPDEWLVKPDCLNYYSAQSIYGLYAGAWEGEIEAVL